MIMYPYLYINLNSFNPVKTKKPYVHRGGTLAIAVQATGLKKEVVAKKAGYTRSSYYKHISQPDLADHILIKYGRVIKNDFSPDIPGLRKFIFEEQPEGYSKLSSSDEIAREREFMAKYVESIEESNRLKSENAKVLKEKVKLLNQNNRLKEQLNRLKKQYDDLKNSRKKT